MTRFAIYGLFVRRIGEWWVETIKMPVKSAEVASYNFAFAYRGLGAAKAENSIIFPVLEAKVVGLLFVPCACSARLLDIITYHYKGQDGLSLLGKLHTRKLFVLSFLPGHHTFEIIP